MFSQVTLQKMREMQTNETEIGDTAASNYICKKKHVQIDVHVQTRFSLFSKKGIFLFRSIFQDFRRS